MWIRSEDRAELVGQGVRLRRELAPGDAHDPVARESQLPISRAVALEGLSRRVDGVAVQLDDDALVRPEGVGLVWAERLVHRRLRQPVSLREVEERRRGCRAIRAARETGLASRRISAWLRACLSCWAVTTAARSKRVRAGLVTGMPSWTVTSSVCSSARCASMPARRHLRGASVAARDDRRRPHSAAADR